MRRVCTWCEAERTSTGLREGPLARAAHDPDPICWFHRLRVLLTSPWRHGVRFLVIVPRSEPELFAWASETLLDEPRVQVVVDRRQAGRHAAEEPPTERRSQIAPWDDARFDAVRIVPTWPTRETRTVPAGQRADDVVLHGRPEFDRWARDGEPIMRALLPALFDRHGELHRRAAAADEVCEQLDARVREMSDESARLRLATGAYREARAEMRDAVRHVLLHLERFVDDVRGLAAARFPAAL
jgi:hypothetical protein